VSSPNATVGTGVGLKAGVGVTDGRMVTVMVCVGSRVRAGIWGVRDGAGVSAGDGVSVAVGDRVGEGISVGTVGLGAAVSVATVGRGLGVLDGVGGVAAVGLETAVGLEIAATSVGIGLPPHDANILNMSSKPQAASPLDGVLTNDRHDLRYMIVTFQYRNG
jgi:hypothetical protein